MCGICGWISYGRSSGSDEVNGLDIEIVNAMNRTLEHRGPDEQGIWTSDDRICTLGHTRLPILDPEGGKQPMSRSRKGHPNNGTFTVTYNGELYNSEDLRIDLIHKGHTFSVYSDVEVLLHAFMEWGTECVQRLNGIYAFLIWSSSTESGFFARDHLGVKPFFYSSLSPDNFIFGSEVKALLEHPLVSREVPLENLADLFASSFARPFGWVPFKDIEELKPGHAGTFSREDGLSIWKYWDVEGSLSTDSIEEAAEKVHFLLKDASVRQMISDVPIGTLLSGGIDSSAITHYICREMEVQGQDTRELCTFSLKLPDYNQHFKPNLVRETNDEDFVEVMCSKYATTHKWMPTSSRDLVLVVEDATCAKDYPIFGDLDTSIYCMMKGIKSSVSVVLDGEASDEIFGGYQNLYIDSFYPGMPHSTATNYEQLLKEELKGEFKLKEKELARYYQLVEACPKNPHLSEEEQTFRERIYIMLKYNLQFTFERKDRVPMASGIELRVPFADHRLVNYAFSLPKSFKKFQGIEKFVLRKSLELEEDFPEAIRTRTKVAYPGAVDPETSQLSRDLLQSLLDSTEDEPLFTWFDKEKVGDAFRNGFKDMTCFFSQPEAIICSNLYSLNYWFKKYKVVVV